MDIEGASALTYFEVIEIVDDNNSYPLLLGIDWAIDMNGVINLKKWTMSFERKSLHVIVPLDPTEGPCYTKLVVAMKKVMMIWIRSTKLQHKTRTGLIQ